MSYCESAQSRTKSIKIRYLDHLIHHIFLHSSRFVQILWDQTAQLIRDYTYDTYDTCYHKKIPTPYSHIEDPECSRLATSAGYHNYLLTPPCRPVPGWVTPTWQNLTAFVIFHSRSSQPVLGHRGGRQSACSSDRFRLTHRLGLVKSICSNVISCTIPSLD